MTQRFRLSLLPLLLVGVVHAVHNVRVGQGVPDVEVNVGSALRVTIAEDAFRGTVDSYKLFQIGTDRLPAWLEWNAKERALLGVPCGRHAGVYYISVSAYATPANGSHVAFAQDVFTLTVRKFASKQELCVEQGEEHLGSYLVLILDRSLEALGPIVQYNLVDEINKSWLHANKSLLSLLAWQEVSPMLGDITTSGRGDLTPLKTTSPGQAVVLQTFGCQPAYAMGVSDALTNLVKRLLANDQVTVGKRPTSSVRMVTWLLGQIKRVKLKRHTFYNDRDVESRYGQIGMSTDIFGSEMHVTQRPRFSVRPTSRIESRPSTHATSTSSRASTTPLRTTARLEPSTVEEEKEITPLTPGTFATPLQNSRPELRKSLGTVICYKGTLCEVRIPDDTFYDQEDGSTVTLRLSLSRLDHEDEAEWLYLDVLYRVLYGLNLDAGQWHFKLTAEDKNNSAVSDAFAIRVLEKSDDEWTTANHKFTLTLAEQFDQIRRRPQHLVKLVNRLAAHLAGSPATDVYVHSLRSGSTLMEWSNRSLLAQERCPREMVERLLALMQTKDGQVRREFVTFMRPEFTPKFVSLTYGGDCAEDALSPPDAGDQVLRPVVTSQPDAGASTLTSTIVPAVVILILLIIAGLLLFAYYCRKSKRDTKEPEDSERKYLSKGKPIIFPDEVDPADKEYSATTPMLMKDEKPPVQVTEMSSFQPNGLATAAQQKVCYVGPMNNTQSDSGSYRYVSTTEDGHSTDEAATTVTDNPLYRPPPPFDSARLLERSPKLRQTHPSFREPPPYVPP